MSDTLFLHPNRERPRWRQVLSAALPDAAILGLTVQGPAHHYMLVAEHWDQVAQPVLHNVRGRSVIGHRKGATGWRGVLDLHHASGWWGIGSSRRSSAVQVPCC